MRRHLCAVLVACCAAAPLSGQAGAVTFSIRGEMPDSTPVPGMGEIDVLITAATDGERIGMQLNLAPGAMIMGMDLSDGRFQAVIEPGRDSIALGLIMPPSLALQMGINLGYRIDFQLPDSTFSLSDSAEAEFTMKVDSAKPVDTGRRDTVAGHSCEVWQQIEKADTVTFCLAEMPAAITNLSEAFKLRFPSPPEMFNKALEQRDEIFGGRNLFPVRIVMTGKESMTMEIISISDQAPDDSFFTLPIDLDRFPIEMFTPMTGGAEVEVDSTEG